MSESRSTSPGTPIPRRPWRAACLTVVMLTTGCATDRDVTNGTVEVTGSGLIGIAAPSFDLSDHDSQRVSLGDYRGQWVVMYFYPEDDTPGCTIQATEFSAMLPELRKIDGRPVAILAPDVVYHRLRRATEIEELEGRTAVWLDTVAQMYFHDGARGRLVSRPTPVEATP